MCLGPDLSVRFLCRYVFVYVYLPILYLSIEKENLKWDILKKSFNNLNCFPLDRNDIRWEWNGQFCLNLLLLRCFSWWNLPHSWLFQSFRRDCAHIFKVCNQRSVISIWIFYIRFVQSQFIVLCFWKHLKLTFEWRCLWKCNL